MTVLIALLTQDDSLGTAVVTGRQGSEALLSRSVLQNAHYCSHLQGKNQWLQTRADKHEQHRHTPWYQGVEIVLHKRHLLVT